LWGEETSTSRLLKNVLFTLRRCIGKLSRAIRANGIGVEIIVLYPFVASLSNHFNGFFSNLLVIARERRER
jgi:hypothetical protein